MLNLLIIVAAAWSDEGGFSLDYGKAISAGIYYGADVLPARAGGIVTFTYALPHHLDVQAAIGAGLETTQNVSFDPIVGVRWGFWQRERQGLVAALHVSFPIGVVVAEEVRASGNTVAAQAALVGIPVEVQLAYGYALLSWFDIGAHLVARIFPATTGEVSGGGGAGFRLGFHIRQRWLIALDTTLRLESTTYPPLSLRIGPTGQLFVVPQATLSGAFRW